MPKKPSSDRKLVAFRLTGETRKKLATLAKECELNMTEAVTMAIHALADIGLKEVKAMAAEIKKADGARKRVPAVIEKAVKAKITNDVVRAVNRAPLFKRNGKLI